MKTKRINSCLPHLEVVPKRIIKKIGLDLPQVADPYAGEIGLVVSEGSEFSQKLVIYGKHVKKKLTIDGSFKFFVPEHEVMCEVDLEDTHEALDYMDAGWLEKYGKESKYADGPQYQDVTPGKYIQGGISET